MDTSGSVPEEGSVPSTGGGESLETMSVVESLVKLGEKQPDETAAEGGGSVEVRVMALDFFILFFLFFILFIYIYI